LPFLHNISSQGKAWREHGIKRSQVVNAHDFILNDFPVLHQWMRAEVNRATEAGWLVDA